MKAFLSKSTLLDNYQNIRQTSIDLCRYLLPEDFVVQPIADVSPPKWHLGHTTWFFETFILKKYHKDYIIFNRSYDFLFNSYYESVGERILRCDRGNITRPVYEEIIDYRGYVDSCMEELLGYNEDKTLAYLVELGIQHEQQHQELLITDIKYILGHNPIFPSYTERSESYLKKGIYRKRNFIEIPEGLYKIGYQGKSFCFDNELPVHKFFVQTFGIMDRLINNDEYLEFVLDGGYKDYRHWHMEGWEIVKKSGWEAPLYWIRKGDQWMEYTSEGLKELSKLAPVTHVSFYEAAAFASWAGKRLATEQEWEAAVSVLKVNLSEGNFLESNVFHPQPADNSFQFFGDCWEWTNSAYLPYPGYVREEGALGEYNGKFMINQMVLKGGSCATPQQHVRHSYRNFFHPDKRWQFTGIRLAEDIK